AYRTYTLDKFARGVAFLSLGLGKKVILANPCGKIADIAFGANSLHTADAWLGALAYAFQIYFDFSGYSDMAIGLGLMFGFVFAKNFDSPYRAESITDFWRRWHISLSTWLRDFIYIPLGGSQCSTARASFNLMVTFTLSGLWHGASWNYVLWGVYWGVLILMERYLDWLGLTKKVPWLVKVSFTFGLTCFGWLLFRERNLAQIIHDLAQSPFAATAEQWRIGIYFVVLVLLYALPLVIHMLATGLPNWQIGTRLSKRGRFVMEAAVAVVLLLGIVTIRSVATSDFIYFQF
ncbi:MAG: MBOAT family O-acyltransferase, partial [Chthoniobacterales bacterium]